MKTASIARTAPIEEKVILSQLIHDTSDVASGWFLRPAGFDPRTWDVQLLSEARSHSSAQIGLDPAASGDVEAYWQRLAGHKPRTTLGRQLWEVRGRIIASGAPLLTWEDIDRELSERRGER